MPSSLWTVCSATLTSIHSGTDSCTNSRSIGRIGSQWKPPRTPAPGKRSSEEQARVSLPGAPRQRGGEGLALRPGTGRARRLELGDQARRLGPAGRAPLLEPAGYRLPQADHSAGLAAAPMGEGESLGLRDELPGRRVFAIPAHAKCLVDMVVVSVTVCRHGFKTSQRDHRTEQKDSLVVLLFLNISTIRKPAERQRPAIRRPGL
jgi:hypothetical protein